MGDWKRTQEYGFTAPLNNKTVSKYLKIALLFVDTESFKGRKEILIAIGLHPDDAGRNGYLSCIFKALTTNDVIQFDLIDRVYKRGENYKEFMGHALNSIDHLKNPSKEVKKFIDSNLDKILKIYNNTYHFILNCNKEASNV